MSKLKEHALIDKVRELQEQLNNAQRDVEIYKSYLETEKERNKKLRSTIGNLKSQIETLEMNAINEDELKRLQVENSKLIVQVNSHKRDEQARSTLVKVAKMLQPYLDSAKGN